VKGEELKIKDNLDKYKVYRESMSKGTHEKKVSLE
jgi:hypothetical protein